MKLMRIGAMGSERPVLFENGRYLDLSAVTPDIDARFWMDDGLERVRVALANNALPSLVVAGQRIGAPIAKPGAVVCIGMNYAAHAAETGAGLPEHLVMFYGHAGQVRSSIRSPRRCCGSAEVSRCMMGPRQAVRACSITERESGRSRVFATLARMPSRS